MKRLLSALLFAITALAAAPAAAHEKVKVVASFSILGDMVQQVTGDLAEVTTIVGPDADAHVYTLGKLSAGGEARFTASGQGGVTVQYFGNSTGSVFFDSSEVTIFKGLIDQQLR